MRLSRRIVAIIVVAIIISSLLWYTVETNKNIEKATSTTTSKSNKVARTAITVSPAKPLMQPIWGHPPRSVIEELEAIISSKDRYRGAEIIDAYPWNKVSLSPYPTLPGPMYMVVPNNTLYLEKFRQALSSGTVLYHFYSLPHGVVLAVFKVMENNTQYIIVYSYIDNIHAWAHKLAEYAVLTLTLDTTCEEALARLLRENLTSTQDIILRIPFPWNATDNHVEVDALAIIDMPVFGKDWPKPIRLIQEKMDWVFLASPAIYYCLNKTLPPRIDLKTMYTNVLPRLIKAIVLPGVMYYPITKNYETPITLRLTERGVCKDYAYASAFLADSLGLVAVDMFGVDPRTGINHSLSGLIIPSSLRIKKGIQVIKDIDGDGEKEYLVPLVDTAKIPLKLLTKGGFTDNLIVDPGIPILGMDPYREKIDYYWYIQYFIGLDKDYKSLPPPFRPKWTAITDKLMLTLAHLYDNITLNYTRLTIKLVVDGDITSKTFSWLAILEKKNNLSMSEIFKLIQSNAVLDISSYKPHEWITVFAEFIASKIILNIVTPPLVLSYDTKVGQTHGIPDWFWKLVYKYWTIGSAETVTPTITQTKKYLQITVSPVFHKEGNKYVFVCLQGSEIINGTKYSVVVRPTNKIGIIQITVTVDDHTYIFTVQNTPSDWPILTIKKAFDGYSGLMICANYTLSDVLSIRLNYTDNRLVVSSNYTVGILGIHYYISIINKTFYMKLYIYSGFPQIMFARITIHYKRGPVIEEVLSPSIYINGSTGGIIDTVEHVLLLKDIKDIDSIIVFVRAIDATLVIYFYPSSSS